MITSKTFDKTGGTPSPDTMIILGSKEQAVIPFDVGSSWTTLNACFLLSCTGPSNDDSGFAQEAITGSGAQSYFYVGFKDSSLNMPGVTGAKYIGKIFGAPNGTNILGTSSYIPDGAYYKMIDTTLTSIASDGGATYNYLFPGSANTHTTPHSVLPVRMQLVVANRGLSNQTLTVRVEGYNSTAVTDARKENALAIAEAFAPLVAGTATAWNNGTTAYPIPNALYLRSSLPTQRVRLHAFAYSKIN